MLREVLGGADSAEAGTAASERDRAVSLASADADARAGATACRLYAGDNLAVCRHLLTDAAVAGKVQMIYLDPPFFSGSDYEAIVPVGKTTMRHPVYQDTWAGDELAYLTMLTARLYVFRDLLAKEGLLWVHLDWHAAHYARLILDQIFGERNFVNEVIWQYKSGGSSKRRFSRKHDTLLVYSKSPQYAFYPLQEKSYNRGLRPYRFQGVEEFQDETGWYTLVNMKDVWELDMVGRTARERTGYATQKPEALLARIVESSTREGDLVLDGFCGSGTLGAVATKKHRASILCDASPLAVVTTAQRVQEAGGVVSCFQPASVPGENPAREPGRRPVTGCGENPLAPVAQLRLETLPEGGRQVVLQSVALGPVVETAPLPAAERSKLQAAAKENAFALIRSWSVDFAYDGRVHRPTAQAVGGPETTGPFVLTGPGGEGPVSVKVVDVFGNTGFSVLP